jgi:prevent-host-death family protein
MVRHVSLRDANQKFAQIVRDAEGGEEIIVTRRGKPVAFIGPARAGKRKLTPGQEEALARLLDLTCNVRFPVGWKFNREEIYDDAISRLTSVKRIEARKAKRRA